MTGKNMGLWLMVGFMVAFAYVAGLLTRDVVDDGAVCHSTTSDSLIVDCDFHDGGWYRK